MQLHAYRPPPRSHHKAAPQSPFSQALPMPKLPTRKGSLAQVWFTRDIVAQTDISTTVSWPFDMPTHLRVEQLPNTPPYNCYNSPLHTTLQLCNMQILMQPIPFLCCLSSCMGPHMEFAQPSLPGMPVLVNIPATLQTSWATAKC